MTMRKVELFLAFFASIVCLGLTTWLAGSIASYSAGMAFPCFISARIGYLGRDRLVFQPV
jgi:hypothetical protein